MAMERDGEREEPPTLALTSHAGLAILLLLAGAYLTGLVFDATRAVHFAIGFALIPVGIVKVGVVTWRMAGYYLGRRAYRAAGPPWLLPRLLAVPLVVAFAVALVSGVVLWAIGDEWGVWSTIHTDSVVILLGISVVHLLIYLRKALRASLRTLAGSAVSPSERVMLWTLMVAMAVAVAGIILEPPWHPTPPPAQGRFHDDG